MVKLKVKFKPDRTIKGWLFVLIAGTVLALLAWIDQRGTEQVRADIATATSCKFTVEGENVSVRTAPDATSAVIDKLVRGATIDGTRVVTGEFRQLAEGRWAANQYLAPVPGTNCG